MDKFVTFIMPKVYEEFLCNKVLFDTVTKSVEANETLCIWGDSGVGKTHFVNYILREHSRFDVTLDTIKDIERVENSTAAVVIDDFEIDKDFIEKIKSGHRFSKGTLLIICRTNSKFDFCKSVKFEHPDVALMVKIALKIRPKEPIPRLTSLAIAARGNIRTFLYSIDFKESRDLFRTPKDFVSDLLCGSENPLNHLGSTISEHGYIWGVIHDNYVDAPNVDFLKISECMSQAEIMDSYIYNGNWDLLPFFCLVSTIEPALEIGHSLKREKIRPGSAWTKFGNHKMRQNKLIDIHNRTANSIDTDALKLIILHCRKTPDRAVEIFKSYGLRPPDIDFINHLFLTDKLSTTQIQLLKKRVSCLATSL